MPATGTAPGVEQATWVPDASAQVLEVVSLLPLVALGLLLLKYVEPPCSWSRP